MSDEDKDFASNSALPSSSYRSRSTPPEATSRNLRATTLHQRTGYIDTSPSSLTSPLPTLNDDSPTKDRFSRPKIPDSPTLWVLLYFCLNLSLTLYNKSVLIHFPFPYTLTALHALCGSIGTFILLRSQPNPFLALSGPERVMLFLFSMLYTLNIVVSNASLRLVTVPFHQVVRSSAPFFTILFAAVLVRKRCTRQKFLSLIPVVAGVGFATYGDYYFTVFGFFLTLLGTLLAALKTVITNIFLIKPSSSLSLPLNSASLPPPIPPQHQGEIPTGIFSSFIAHTMHKIFPPSPSSSPTYSIKPLPKVIAGPVLGPFTLPKLSLSPLHLLYLLSPLAFVQTTLLAHFTGELDRVRWYFLSASTTSTLHGSTPVLSLLLNGILAFILNVVSFNANRRVGPLGMSVAANVKQVLTILCAVFMFDLTITLANALGIFLTLVGGGLYAFVEYREKQEKERVW